MPPAGVFAGDAQARGSGKDSLCWDKMGGRPTAGSRDRRGSCRSFESKALDALPVLASDIARTGPGPGL